GGPRGSTWRSQKRPLTVFVRSKENSCPNESIPPTLSKISSSRLKMESSSLSTDPGTLNVRMLADPELKGKFARNSSLKVSSPHRLNVRRVYPAGQQGGPAQRLAAAVLADPLAAYRRA